MIADLETIAARGGERVGEGEQGDGSGPFPGPSAGTPGASAGVVAPVVRFALGIALRYHDPGMPFPHLQRWTTIPALTAYLGVNEKTVRRWIARHDVRAVRVQNRHYTDDRPRLTNRGQWRIYESDLLAFLAQLRAGTPLPEGRGFWRR